MKKQLYQVRVTVWEYYEIEATSKKEAASLVPKIGDPFMVKYRSSKVTRSGI